MPVEFFFGLALLIIAVYILFRILGNLALGAILILIVFLASYILVGSFPNLNDIPIIGKFIPTTGKVIAAIKDFAYSIDIVGVSKSSTGNLLVTIVNTGQSELSNFTVFIDGEKVKILNNNISLKSGNFLTLELDWKDDFEKILVKTDKTEAIYEKQL